jgi:uncharacterized cupredoxin-like copper-binding protein
MKRLLLIGAFAVVALIAACGGNTATTVPAASSAASVAAGGGTPVTVKDFKIEPVDVKVSGTNVSLAVSNQGPTVHNVTIRDASGTVLGATSDLKAGASETLTVQLQPGSYVLFCSLAGHESLGTKAALTVTAP